VPSAVAPSPARLGYRPALDGIRGVAVLAVMAHHTGVRHLRGGMVGVDVFFVLSGFLITTLLVEEWVRAGRVDIPAFYRRRALRLFPAVVALLGVFLVAGTVAHSALLDSTRRGLAPVAFYVADWVAARGVDLGAVHHTWSLAVEEQFYLLWPVILIMFLRAPGGRDRALWWCVVGITAVTLLRAAAWHAGVSGERLYFGPDARADALLLGCVLALAGTRLPRSLASRAAAGAGVVALAVIVAWFHSGDGRWYIGGFTVAALSAAAVIAHVVREPGGRMASALTSRPLVHVGRISYGLYLWHFPIFTLLRVPSAPLRAVPAIALSFACAEVSAALIERPMLARKGRSRPRYEAASSSAISV
jgi:peptidoglycan/LPS O-acetylase OafA/YrhL